jgi:hypothetical protein
MSEQSRGFGNEMSGKESSFRGGGTHEEFLALCALSTSGELSNNEYRKLEEHLSLCDQCRHTKRLFEEVVEDVIPVIAADNFEDKDQPAEVDWLDRAEVQFFQRLALEKASHEEQPAERSVSPAYGFSFTGSETWRNIWALSFAGLLLAIALGVSAYQIGTRKGFEIARLTAQARQSPTTQSLIAKRESEVAQVQVQVKERNGIVDALRRRLRLQSIELNQLRNAQQLLDADLHNSNTSEQNLIQQRNELLERMDAAQARIRNLEVQIDAARSRESQDAASDADLQAKATELTRLLKERDDTIAEDEDLLAHDRDIRELIGARDLHVAEVYDVARTGQTEKPYGRVFYTKGRSLIFYAYDLDQVQEKNADFFQAWGLRGPDRKQALSLGIFYKDNASKKRWILKFDDPKTLAQIDAVFVTVEPGSGNHEPSGKPHLFAYLNGDPNHP